MKCDIQQLSVPLSKDSAKRVQISVDLTLVVPRQHSRLAMAVVVCAEWTSKSWEYGTRDDRKLLDAERDGN
ncbi:MAG: hypothetical protein HP497_05000 [Nitrospira sp.]|nr:hypothetical protein [Nitrospira sp.]